MKRDPARADQEEITLEIGKPRPYLGGRAQAESGARIIENDYDAWRIRSCVPGAALPADHPRVVQLVSAWRMVAEHRLGDDPSAAAIRYQVLAHTAHALAEVPAIAEREVDAAVVTRLAEHARQHAMRLRATGEHQFESSAGAGPYSSRAQAESASRVIERYYRSWADSPVVVQAERDAGLRERVGRLRDGWDNAHRHELADGTRLAATSYHELAEAAFWAADTFTANLQSAALKGLLELGVHARKHAIRLQATARSAGTAADCRALPGRVATAAARVWTSDCHSASSRGGNDARRAADRDRHAAHIHPARPQRGE